MRRRLVIAIAAVATTAIVLFAIPLALVLQRSYRDEDLLRLQRDTVAATRAIDVSGKGDPIELPPSRDTLTVYDRRARRVAGSGPATGGALVQGALRTGRTQDEARGGRLVVAVPLLTGERVVGAVRAVRSDAGAAADTHNAWLLLGAVALGLVALSVAAALVLGRRLARPLERLTVAARRLGEGDFSVRAPRSRMAEIDGVGRALDTTAERLDTLLTREREFSADASHQLRTPLAALRLELESLELTGGAPDQVRAALEQAGRLQQTIDTLLAVRRDTKRDDSGADLPGLLDAIEADWRGALAAQARPLRMSIPRGPTQVSASASLVREILDVLLDNAARHGGGAVSLSLRELGSSVAVEVADEGPGFADAASAFARHHADAGGHGIGLALARSLAEAEGGSLEVTRAGPHPVVRLLLPAANRPPQSQSPASATASS